MLALIFCAVISTGCGGGSDSSDPEQTESLNDDTGSYEPNSGGRGKSSTKVDLSNITAAYTVHDGETLTGKLGSMVKISVADGATVTLSDVTIRGIGLAQYRWAGLTCEGNATIILEGTNFVRGFNSSYPGIRVLEGKTLTIKGSGSLEARSNGYGAGIGGGWEIPCGNIVIEGGTITANAGMFAAVISGNWAAGIGGGYASNCGNIIIDGGTINATGGTCAAGIGGGRYGKCGNITITNNITRVTATKDVYHSPYSIGGGQDGSCGTVTMGGLVTGPIAEYQYTYTGTIDLSKITADYTAQDGELLTGKLGREVKISVADGAAITLYDVTIEGYNKSSTPWAGLTCRGVAALILMGTNYVQRAHEDYPAIYVPEYHMLNITGSGELTADANGSYSAGIGGGEWSSCGNIFIDGGTIEAIGGRYSAGIGGGRYGNCGYITIKDTVTKVKATKGEDAPYSIGAGKNGSCSTVMIGDDIGSRSDPTCTYPPDAQ